MKLFLDENGRYIDTELGKDLSISFGGKNKVNAWYLDDPVISPVKTEDFIGSVSAGAPVNFNNIFFNPHAHVTHTECMGHITKEVFSVNEIAHPLFYKAYLVSVSPEKRENGDFVITLNQLQNSHLSKVDTEAIIIRTLPNSFGKKQQRYSHSNPPYIDVACAAFLESKGIKHLLIDLPSVDKEEDGGELLFHHAFWKVPENPQENKTITEFIYVSDEIEDGEYMLNLQVAPIHNDASPSRPMIYELFDK